MLGGSTLIISNAYFPWTPDYTPFTLGSFLSFCLNIPNFSFVYIDLMIFQYMILVC